MRASIHLVPMVALAWLSMAACHTSPPVPTPEISEVHIAIGKMQCEGCVMTIVEALRAVDGVITCSVSLQTKRALIRYDPARTNTSALVDRITSLGYEARVVQADAAAPTPAEAAD